MRTVISEVILTDDMFAFNVLNTTNTYILPMRTVISDLDVIDYFCLSHSMQM